VTSYIDEACAVGVRLEKACRVVGICPRTLQRWRQAGALKADGRQSASRRRTPANRLSEAERQQLLAIANEPADRPPSQIVPRLADQGRYVASESSFYRVLREANQLAHREKGSMELIKNNLTK
jgi:hypothetical protein